MRQKDMRKRLALFYKWGNKPVELIKFFRGEIDAAAGGRTEFQRGIMGMFSTVEKEIMGTAAQLRTSITYIRRFLKELAFSSRKRRTERSTFPASTLRAKRGAGKITADALFGAGRKINALGFPAAAVIVIVRGKDQMASNFPGNRGRALAKFVRNPFEAPSFFDASLDRDSVRECKVFAFVGFNKSIHK